MTDARVGERDRERAAHEWYGAPREGQVPVRASEGADAAASAARRVPARWKRFALRVLRDALIGAVLVATIPLGLVTFTGRQLPYLWYQTGTVNTLAKLREAEQVRFLASPADPAVSAERAGLAMAALSAGRSLHASPEFLLRPATERLARPWDDRPMPRDLFGEQRSWTWNGPAPRDVITSAARGPSPKEVDYLRTIVAAPVWPAFDLVTSAATVDVIGGRFELPFSRDARSQKMPLWDVASSKELAYANISRAAYYLAIGKPAEADAMLRRTIRYGFVFIDNPTSVMDALIGRLIVGVGREALQDLYTATGDPRLAEVVAAGRQVTANRTARRGMLSTEEARQVHLGNANNAALPRAVRLEHLYMLAQSVCTNPRELVLGPGRDVRDAFARADGNLARFPSERAMLDLMLQTPSLPVEPAANVSGSVRLVVGASTIAGLIFDNPRLTYCTRVITSSLR